MVNAVYDHIVAIIVVSVIFVSSVIIVPHVNLRNLLAVNQQQLRNTALNTFNAMLLDTGYPADWGSRVNETFYFHSSVVERFGLASVTPSTFYMLDPDKVQRLDTVNPLGFLSYEEMRALLGLKNYGFHFKIIPPFNVTNVNGIKIDENHSPINKEALEEGVLEYAVKVSYLDGRPIYNATVLATAIFTWKGKGSEGGFNYTSLLPVRTDILGICRQNVTLLTDGHNGGNGDYELTSLIVILRINVANVATLVVTFGENPGTIVDINMVSDTIVLTEPKGAPNAAIELKAIYVYGSQETPWLLYEGQGPPDDKFNTGKGQHSLWNRTFPGLHDYDPNILVFHLWNVEEGREEIVVAGPYRNLMGYTVFTYGGPVENAAAAVKLQRNVIIAGMTYTAELWLWKE